MEYLALYAVVLVVLWALYVRRQRRIERVHAQQLQQSLEAGLGEPPSLHPVVDAARCLASSSCVKACPEEALGIVDGTAVLVNAAACIGHGACAAAWPVDAITLVFGTEKRGIDIPAVTPEFELNVPGLFIAGELGGMGLIRKAAEQGRQAIAVIRRRVRVPLPTQQDRDDGTGEIGAGGYGALRRGAEGNTAGLLARCGRQDRPGDHTFQECMQGIDRDGDGFVVRTDRNTYRTRSVLLALGRRGTPRKLEVPGEESPKVVYRLIDPSPYHGQAVLVVGGGASALEAAGARDQAQRAGRVRVELESTVHSIEADRVKLQTAAGLITLRNAAVIVCVGGQLPTPLLQSMGISFDTKYGTA